MITIDVYWQDWGVRIGAPEATYLCATHADAQNCINAMTRAGAQKVVINPHESVGQSPVQWKGGNNV